MSPRFRNLLLFLFLPLFLYFSMYTWNWKTGVLDSLSTAVGLEVTGWVFAPGRWLQNNIDEFWSRYIYLVGVRQENEDLVQKVGQLEQRLAGVEEKAKAADRMATLLQFTPEPSWARRGCRVIGQELGPTAVLDAMLVDVGSTDNVRPSDPVVSTRGVVGRVAKASAHFSTVLLLTDPGSRIPVLTSEGRVPAIVQGQGAGAYLEVKFIPHNDPVKPDEILITSGLGGVFPKGIPVARVVQVIPGDVSLFQKVYAEPLLAIRYYEELLVLSRSENATVYEVANATVMDSVSSATAPSVVAPVANATGKKEEKAPMTRHRVRKKP